MLVRRAPYRDGDARLPVVSGGIEPLPAIGTALCLASAILLRRSRWRTGRRPGSAIAGGFVLVLALGLFVRSMGGAAGGVAWLLAFGLGGLAITLQGHERRTARTRSRRKGQNEAIQPDQRPQVRWRGWARASAALLLTLLAADAICAAAAGIASGPAAMRFSAAMLVQPLLWSGLVIWTLSDRVLHRPIIGMTGALAASGAIIAGSVLTW